MIRSMFIRVKYCCLQISRSFLSFRSRKFSFPFNQVLLVFFLLLWLRDYPKLFFSHTYYFLILTFHSCWQNIPARRPTSSFAIITNADELLTNSNSVARNSYVREYDRTLENMILYMLKLHVRIVFDVVYSAYFICSHLILYMLFLILHCSLHLWLCLTLNVCVHILMISIVMFSLVRGPQVSLMANHTLRMMMNTKRAEALR